MDHIRILGHRYSFVSSPRLSSTHGARGECRHNLLEIAIDETLPASLVGQTIIHEILEALSQQLDLKLEHEKINQLDAGLTQVFRDNPNLKNYFFGGDE